MITAAILEVASYADVSGLAWDELEGTGNGLLDSDEYIFQLNETWDRFDAVTRTLAISAAEWEETTAAQARAAWAATTDELGEKADAILDAITSFEVSLAWDRAVTLYTGYLRSLLIAGAVSASAALESHESGMVRYAVVSGQMTPEEARRDADNIQKFLAAVVKLDDWGFLKELKKPRYVSGVGAAAAVAARGAPLVWAAVAALAVIAAAAVVIWSINETNERRDKWCLDENNEIRPNAPGWCYEEPGDPLSVFLEPLTKTGAALGTAVGVVLGVGALVWVGSTLLPKIVKARGT